MAESTAAPVEAGRLPLWVSAAMASDGFWGSAPRWRADVARIDLPHASVVWGASGLFDVEVVGAAVAAHFDGDVSLAELADDLAVVAGASQDVARTLVATLTVEMVNLSAIDGVALPDPPTMPPGETMATASSAGHRHPAGTGETVRIDPDTGLEIRVVTEAGPNGALVTTEYLPNGRRRMYGAITFSTDQIDQAATAADVLAGHRSAAELVPADTCLGSKLRNDDSVPLVSRRGPDGHIRSVRCHDHEVADLLHSRFGASLEPNKRGPIEVFVVTPLEGSGPLRIYDGVGTRRGRPRTVADAASVVDQILGEREALAMAGSRWSVAPIPLALVLVGGPDGVDHLVSLDALRGPGLVNRLVNAGYRPTFGRALLHGTGDVVASSGPGVGAGASSSLRVHLGHEAPRGASQVAALLGEMALPGAAAPVGVAPGPWRRHVLASVAGLAERAEWSRLAGPLDEHLGVAAGSR